MDKARKPTLYILCGLPYSGKTTVAKALVRQFGWDYVSIDIVRERLGFTWKENDKVTSEDWKHIFDTAYGDMFSKLQNGKSVIFDSTNHDFESREKLRVYAKESGAESKVIFIDVPVEVVWQRWRHNQEANTRSHIGKELVQWTMDHFESPTEEENVIRYNASANLENWIQQINTVL